MSLELTLPIVVIASLLLLVWDDFARTLDRARENERDEFDEETTLEEWLGCFPAEPHLSLLERPETQ